MSTERLIRLGQTYGHSCGLALSTVGRLAGGHGAFFARVAEGRVTFRRVDRAIQWFSDHWPVGVRWPEEVVRPAPAPGSAAARSALRPPEPSPDETVRSARQRVATATARGDPQGVRIAEQAAIRAGMGLGPNHRIASPEALCEALQVSRAVYYDVVRRFAHGRGAHRRTRPGSDSDRMLRVLTDAGDARFAFRREPAANSGGPARLRALPDGRDGRAQGTMSNTAGRTAETATASVVDELQELEQQLDALSHRFLEMDVSRTDLQRAEALSALAMRSFERIGESLARRAG